MYAVERPGMSQRTHQCEPIGNTGGPGQALADLNAGDRSGNRLHLPLDLGRRRRLGIERFVLRMRAEKVDENARFCPAKESSTTPRGNLRSLQPNGIGHTKAQ
jgi:hypothetical protein